jgi:hypothetical protein
MTRYLKLLPVAALLGLAGPALAAQPHAAKVDPQAASTTTKGHTHKAPATHSKAQVQGRHATKTAKSKKSAAKTDPQAASSTAKASAKPAVK